jgi:hypothetical protein
VSLTVAAGVSPGPLLRSISAVRPTRSDRRKTAKSAEGRFQAQQNARTPANGFAVSRSAHNVPTTIGVVPDPYDNSEKLAVSINRKVDVLEWEYSHGRLSEAAYRTGRIVQATFERATGRSQSSWSLGDRVDAFQAKELQLITALQKAEAVTEMMARIVKSIGTVGARALRSVLADGQTYAQVAAARGQSGEAAVTFAAKRFRLLLEELAEDWAASGQSRIA